MQKLQQPAVSQAAEHDRKGEQAQMEITILKHGYQMEDAFERLYKRSKHFKIEQMGTLFYPYLKATYEVIFSEKKLKRLNTRVICMVDLYTGRISLGKTQGTYFTQNVKDEYIIPIKVGREEALKGCPIEVSTVLIQQRKMPKVPKISLEDDVVIYRPFYIVECLNEDNENFHILFDAVTGDFSLLDS